MVAAEAAPKKNGVIRTATIRLSVLNARSVGHMRGVACRFLDPDHGDLLQVIDLMTDKVIVDPRLGIRVDSNNVALALMELNISDGKVSLTPP